MDAYVPSAVDQSWNPRPKRGWVKWVVVGAVGVVLVGALTWWLLTRKSAPPTLKQQATVAAEQAMADCAKTPDAAACSQLVVAHQAAVVKETSVCDVLKNGERDQCVVRTAFSAGDVSLCDAVSDAGVRDLCKRQFVRMDAANCRELGGGQTECDTEAAYEAALKSGDPASCASSDPVVQQNCTDMLGELDQDGDGLTFVEEHRYGSSDTNPDSDGDGFKDGDEVAAGFNPNGPGTL